MNAFRVAALLCVCVCGSILAQQTNVTVTTPLTIDGVTYSNVTWGTVTPATVSIFHKTGVASIPLEKLPPELQKRFGYDPKKAAEYRAAEAAWAGRTARRKEALLTESANCELDLLGGKIFGRPIFALTVDQVTDLLGKPSAVSDPQEVEVGGGLSQHGVSLAEATRSVYSNIQLLIGKIDLMFGYEPNTKYIQAIAVTLQ